MAKQTNKEKESSELYLLETISEEGQMGWKLLFTIDCAVFDGSLLNENIIGGNKYSNYHQLRTF